MLTVYTIYNLFEELEVHESYAILLSLIMSIIMLKKAKYGFAAAKNKSLTTVKKMYRKATLAAILFGLVYALWCLNIYCNFVQPTVLERHRVENIIPDNISVDEKIIIDAFPYNPRSEIVDKYKYVRIGGPARHEKPHQKLNRQRHLESYDFIDTDQMTKAANKALSDQQVMQEYKFLYSLDQEITLIFGLFFATLYFVAKKMMYFKRFNTYYKAVSSLEQVNILIAHFDSQTPIATETTVKREEVKSEPVMSSEAQTNAEETFIEEPSTEIENNIEPEIQEELIPAMPVEINIPSYETTIYEDSDLPCYPVMEKFEYGVQESDEYVQVNSLEYPNLEEPLNLPSQPYVVEDTYGRKFLINPNL